MKITVIGTGYVGLVTGTGLAEMGNEVVCVDIDQEKVQKLGQGTLTIFEPGLDSLFQRNLKDGRLTFTTRLEDGLFDSEVVFLALPTPPREDGSADLSYVLGVARRIGQLLSLEPEKRAHRYQVIVNKSTVPVGTAERVREALENPGFSAGTDFDVVSNPEFLREGVAVEDFLKPDRVVIGASSPRAVQILKSLYEPFVRNGNPILVMDERSAEMTKYAANAFLASKITFMNEIANLCDKTGADVDQVRLGIGSDNRVNKQFLYAGIGFGGSCFPKDVQALVRIANSVDYDFRILDAVLEVNSHQRVMLASRIEEHFGGNLKKRRIAVWGLAFKPNTDDVREAPSHSMIRALLSMGATIRAFDPEAMETTKAVLGDGIEYAADAYSALDGADALVICTEWNLFRRPDFEKMKALLKQALIFDGRNLYDPSQMAMLGFQYFSIGRPSRTPRVIGLLDQADPPIESLTAC